MKTFLTMRAELYVEVDTQNPKHLADAIAWMTEVAKGKITTPDDALGVSVDVRKEAEIVRRKE